MIARFFTAVLIVLAGSIVSAADSGLPKQGSYSIDRWEVSRDEAVKRYFSGSEYAALSFPTIKEFDNRVYSHLVAVYPDVAQRIAVIRSKTRPERDILLIDGKFLSLLERQGLIDSLQFKTLFVALKDTYGIPQMTKENDYTVYTYKNDKTQALLQAKVVGEKYEIKVYLYSQSIFKRLFLEQ